MKQIALVLLALLAVQCRVPAQEKPIITQQNPTELVGIKQKSDLEQAPFSSWYAKNFDSYALDQATIDQIKKYNKGVSVKCFMGTWCGDSKRETPRFYKVMEAAGISDKNIELITVNRSKKTPSNLEKGLNIIRVPTFIFYKGGKEVGRYVEFPRESLEKDILKILSGQPYKNSYDRS